MPANLPLRNRSNPSQAQIDRNGDDADNPKHLLVILVIIPEDNRKDDAPQIPHPARDPADDAVGMRVHVRDEREVGAVAGLEEEGHAGDEAEHGALVVAVRQADGDLEGARHDREAVDQVLLAPDARAAVERVGDEAADGSAGDVEQAEHGGPAACARLAELREVLEVVGAQDGVDGELGAEGAEVAHGHDEGLEGEDDGHGFLEGGFLDDFAAGDVEHLLFADLGFAVVDAAAAFGVENHLGITMWRWGAGFRAGGFLFGDRARNLDDVAGYAVFGQILLCS